MAGGDHSIGVRGRAVRSLWWWLAVLVMVLLSLSVVVERAEAAPVRPTMNRMKELRAQNATLKDFLLVETGFMSLRRRLMENGTGSPVLCRLRPVADGVYDEIVDILTRQAKLIYLNLDVQGYAVNPLAIGNTWSYKTDQWARVGSNHGQTILNLAFTYGVLSLMTLKFGVIDMDIMLEDVPFGCIGNLTEKEKIDTVLDLAIRDFKEGGEFVVVEEHGSICHQIIKDQGGYIKFTDRVCARKRESDEIICTTDLPNKWLDILDILLCALIFLVFAFGPASAPDWMYAAAMETTEYYVKLKEPLYKTMAVCRRDNYEGIDAAHVLDLRNHKRFKMVQEDSQ